MCKRSVKLFQKIMALAMAVLMLAGLAACGGKSQEAPAEAEGRTVIYYAASYVSAQVQDSYKELVRVYNETQGVEDNVFVQMRENAGAIAGLDSALRSNYQYDVLELRDDEFKTLAMQGGNYFITLDDYITDDVKAAMQWNDIPSSMIDRFRMNTTPSEGGKFMAGTGASLLALPNGTNPHIMFYNKTLLADAGVNLISVPEAELEAYNAANGSTLQPHGYAEYKEAPYADAKSSRNEAGEFVYKVFNECIAINWEEQRMLARACMASGSEYGFMSEWWFNMGFSVGGDCIGWDEEKQQYVLTLTDKMPGYLALEDVTVNGKDYQKGDVLLYEEKRFLNENPAEVTKLQDKIYALPSMYDAILEFTRLGVPADKQPETGINGYGLAPTTTANRTARFTSASLPLYIESYAETQSFKSVLGDALGMAPPAQYREYVGGSTYEKDGKEYLKVIGESYDGQVYTGELKTVNGTPIVGEAATDSETTGLFIPANTKNKNYDAAAKFVCWAAGPEGQKILAKGNRYVPNQTTYAMGEYADDAARLIPNTWVGGYMAQEAEIGDYTYFTSLTWITEWSVTFNKDVREGVMTISDFIAQKQDAADHSLKGMRLRILGR